MEQNSCRSPPKAFQSYDTMEIHGGSGIILESNNELDGAQKDSCYGPVVVVFLLSKPSCKRHPSHP